MGRTVPGSRFWNALVNQRSAVPSAIGSMPWLRTVAARWAQARTRTGRLPSPSRVPSISRAGSCAGAAPSDIEEHRLPGALEAEVEAEYAGAGARLRGGDQRGAPVRVDRAEHRVAVVRGLLVGE